MKSRLSAGQTYRIVIETSSRFAMVADSYGNKDIIRNRGGKITIQDRWNPGRLGVYLAPLNARDAYSHSYDGFLEYQVD
ncbi:MAG: hypothetical protein DRP60_16965 [Spirochaetes bacterium]|nr:MAG: hypothetical protein DRP60_16965 [Spirochaetota bacterium]